MDVSLIAVLRDEEHYVARMLKSVLHKVSEVVVIDQESIDRTREIVARECRLAGVPLIMERHPPTKIPEPSLGRAVELATKEWILRLDGDEEAGPGLIDALSKRPDKDGYILQRRNAISYKGINIFEWVENHPWLVRLLRREKIAPISPGIHTTFQLYGSLGTIKRGLLHYRDAKRFYENNVRYQTIINREDQRFFIDTLGPIIRGEEAPTKHSLPWKDELLTW